MKTRSRFPTVSIVLAILGGALTFAPPAPGGTFVKTIGGDEAESFVALAAYDEDEFVAVGPTDSFGAGREDILLTRFDFRGNIRWTRVTGDGASDEPYAVAVTSDGSIVVTGRTRSSVGAGDWDLFLVKFRPDGEYIWAVTLGGEYVDEGFGVIETHDGDLVVVGDTNSPSAGLRWDLLIAKFNANGDLLWDTEAFSTLRHNWGYRVVEMPDRGFLVAGGTSSGLPADQDILLARFDRDGHIDWSRRIGDPRPDWEWARNLIHTSDGGYALSGWSEDDLAGSSSFVVKLDSAAEFDWGRRAYGSSSYRNQAPGLTETQDGNLVVAGSYYYPGAGYDVWLAKWAGHDGTPIWSRRFGGLFRDDGQAVLQDLCGGLMVVGGTTSFGSYPPNALWARCTRDGKSCLTTVDGPSSSRWSPPDESAPLGELHVLGEYNWFPENTAIDPPVTEVCVECPADINCDGCTDLRDLAILLAAYDACVGDPRYLLCADFNADGCVDLSDLAFLLADYGCCVDP